MALKDGYSYTYKMAADGVNLYSDIFSLRETESPFTGNCFYRNGMMQRKGMSKLATTAVLAGNAGTTLHRFHYGSNSKKLLASSGTVVKVYNTATGVWDDVKTGLTNNAQITMETWGPKDSVYIANGADTVFKYDGTNTTNLTAFPATTRQILPILDRLLFIDGTNPSFLQRTGAYDDTTVVVTEDGMKVSGAGQIEGMAYLGLQTSVGFANKVLVFKGGSIWLLTVANLATGANFDARIDLLAANVGCTAWRTAKPTPIGTFFLGNDRQVYLVDLEANILPVGSKIRSNRSEVGGIESIPVAQLSKCTAVYHDGFYKLFIPAASGTFNSIQYWLDVNRFSGGTSPLTGKNDALYGPWYGPMTGQNIAHAIVQDGPGDDGALMGIEADGAVGSFVYTMDTGTQDVSTAIRFLYQTFYADHGRPDFTKVCRLFDIEIADISGTLNLSFYDSTGAQSSGNSISLTGSTAVYWGDSWWGDSFWSSPSTPTRVQIYPNPKIDARYLAVEFDFSSASERFILYTVGVEGQVRSRKPYIGTFARV